MEYNQITNSRSTNEKQKAIYCAMIPCVARALTLKRAQQLPAKS